MNEPRPERADRIRDVIRAFQAQLDELNKLQVGDYYNEISPIKHAIADAITPQLIKLGEIAVREHYGEQNP